MIAFTLVRFARPPVPAAKVVDPGDSPSNAPPFTPASFAPLAIVRHVMMDQHYVAAAAAAAACRR